MARGPTRQRPYGYTALYQGQQWTLYDKDGDCAYERAVNHFTVPKSKLRLLTVQLTEVNGKPITQAVTS